MSGRVRNSGRRSDDTVEGCTGSSQCINPAFYSRIVDEWRCMVRLDAGVNHQGARTAPMLAMKEGTEAINVRGRIGPGKRDPEKVVEGTGGELRIVHYDDKRKRADGICRPVIRAEARHVHGDAFAVFAARRSLDGKHSRQANVGTGEAVGKA